jgi:hypothetical protein
MTYSSAMSPLTSGGGQQNYEVSWSSGGCGGGPFGACAYTITTEKTAMSPNTQWSVQDNTYDSQCHELEYQDYIQVGTSGNSYTNYFEVEWWSYPNHCGGATTNYAYYSILPGTNLNSGAIFYEYFGTNSGYATNGWLEVDTGGYQYLSSANMPSGNPNVPIAGWEDNLVCSYGGCTVSFSSGSGSIAYYQSNIKIGSLTVITGEKSNCGYSTISTSGSSGTQTFSC